ncbi:MAG: hypothetical protein A2W91_10970 [Bacteroidetes bacterium GWF2_38_335]|nr:MAG: hypothetical protein A2W91_10970 [Bacteroidetes bacterium GWF2_38_335]OFY81777.1 MAG: hypothetical protein A2281_06070 [Bacteroidetes bacterium RIFOXYA12_FULL_38_20]HBS87847.1 hypothetical protein [Bacteroidales bacterium]
MKTGILALLIVTVIISTKAYSQTVINGSFEDNLATDCLWNNPNSTFNSLMSDCFAFGPGEEVDIQKGTCGYAIPAKGEWFISLASNIGSPDQVALKLSSPLIAGNGYHLTFSQKADTNFTVYDSLLIGVSDEEISFGIQIYSVQPVVQTGWTETAFDFIAPLSGQYITFGNKGERRGWNFIDNVQIMFINGMGEIYNNQAITIYPNPFSVETILQSNQVLKNAEVTLYNSSGQVIKQISNISGQSVSIQRDKLPGGLYFIQLTQNGILFATEKLVIID